MKKKRKEESIVPFDQVNVFIRKQEQEITYFHRVKKCGRLLTTNKSVKIVVLAVVILRPILLPLNNYNWVSPDRVHGYMYPS